MFIYEHGKNIYGPRDQYIGDGKKELSLEDLALKRALLTWKQQAFPRPLEQRSAFQLTSRENTTLFTERRDFLKGLKTESPDVKYEQFPSPEFKPGRFFYFPSGEGTRNYRERRIGQEFCPTQNIVSPGNQLCNKMRRKIFCEVLQEDKLCLDCNSRIVRRAFNSDMKTEFPFLKYDRVKRPYGFCPRAIRLTEPLPSRGSEVFWHDNCECTRTKSAILPAIKQCNSWIDDLRPITT